MLASRALECGRPACRSGLVRPAGCDKAIPCHFCQYAGLTGPPTLNDKLLPFGNDAMDITPR